MQALLAELEMDPRARRRRLVASVGAAVVGLGLAVGGYAWWQAQPGACDGQELRLAGIWDADVRGQVRQAFLDTRMPYSEAAAGSVERILDQYGATLVDAGRQVCTATFVEGTQSPELMEERQACVNRRVDALEETTRIFTNADAQVVEHAVAVASALSPVDPCLDRGSDGGVIAAQVDPGVARRHDRELARADSLQSAAKYEEARALLLRLLDELESGGDLERQGRAKLLLGAALLSAGQHAEAEDAFFEALALGERAGDRDTGTRALIKLVATVGSRQARYAEGHRLAQQAMARLARRGLDDNLDASLHYELGTLRYEQGDYEGSLESHREALEIRERVLPANHPSVAGGLNAIGLVHHFRGDFDRAQEHFDSALAMYGEGLGDDHPEVASVLNNLGITAGARGDLDGAIEYHRRALAIRERSHPEHPLVVSSLSNVGNIHQSAGRYEEALEYQERAAVLARKIHGEQHPMYGMAQVNVGTALLGLGRTEDALAAQENARRIYAEALPREHANQGYPIINIAEVLMAQGRHEEAAARAREARTHWEGVFGLMHPLVSEAATVEGEALLQAGERAAAVERLERALVARRKQEPGTVSFARTALSLARALGKDDRERARSLADEASTIYRDSEHEDELRDAERLARKLR